MRIRLGIKSILSDSNCNDFCVNMRRSSAVMLPIVLAAILAETALAFSASFPLATVRVDAKENHTCNGNLDTRIDCACLRTVLMLALTYMHRGADCSD